MNQFASNHIISKYRHLFSILLLAIFSIMLYPPNWFIQAPGCNQTVQIAEEEETHLAELTSFSSDMVFFESENEDLNTFFFIFEFGFFCLSDFSQILLEIIAPPPRVTSF